MTKVKGLHRDFHSALEHSAADLVYVSTVNSEHVRWAEAALERGFHVIVDKPAVLHVSEAQKLVDLARRQGRVLAESTVWAAHPQIESCRAVFADAHSEITRVEATFCMPPLDPGDFRYRRDAGGGALWDLGPYAVSAGRVFLSAGPPIEVSGGIHGWREGEDGRVETAFSVLLRYAGGRAVVGHFGFDTEYRNAVTLLGPGACLGLERVFTTPAELANPLRARIRNEARVELAPAGDAFASFLTAVLGAVEGPGAEDLAQVLLEDARALALLRQRCLGET
jgi:predicted dehydrogenase